MGPSDWAWRTLDAALRQLERNGSTPRPELRAYVDGIRAVAAAEAAHHERMSGVGREAPPKPRPMSDTATPSKRDWTTAELADALNITTRQVLRRVDKLGIPGIRKGGTAWLWPHDSLTRLRHPEPERMT